MLHVRGTTDLQIPCEEEQDACALTRLTVTENGIYMPDEEDGYYQVDVNVPSGYPEPTGTKTITANGTGIDVKDFATADVNVPNSYSASDEGKVVSSGALVAQGSQTITQNGTYDTTLISELIANISGGGGGKSDNDFLFHFDSDFENSGKTPTVPINVTGLEISAEQSKFGGKSLKTGTTQTYGNIMLPYDFALGSDDFTLDFWCYPTNLSGSSERVPIAFDYRSLAVYITTTTFEVAVAKSSSSWFDTSQTSVSFSNNQWYHIAIVRDGTDLYYFVNGTKVKTLAFGSDAFANISKLTLGSNTYDSGNRRFNGYIDELRLKIGEAVWTDDFTPPTEPYPDGNSGMEGFLPTIVCKWIYQYGSGWCHFATDDSITSEYRYDRNDSAVSVVYGDTTMINTYGLVLLGDFSQGGASTNNVLSDSIENYSAIILEGIYQKQRSSKYNTNMLYYPITLNKQYWSGMKDRNSSYDCQVTFTDDTHVSLSGDRQVMIYGVPKEMPV